MRFHSSLCALILVAATPSVAQTVPVRQTVPIGAPSFTSKVGGFSLWLPIQPTQSKEIISLDFGETTTSYDFEAQTETLRYSIQALETPFSADITSPQLQIDAMQGAMLANGGKVRAREAIQLLGFPGRDIKAELGEDSPLVETARVRMFFTPRFLYTISVIGPVSEMQAQNAEVERVLGSFRIAPEQNTPRIPTLFTYPAEGFAVRLPIKPLRNPQKFFDSDGTMKTLNVLQTKTEGVVYVIIVQRPNSSLLGRLPAIQMAVFERQYLRGIASQSPGANVQKRTDFQLDGFPGREFKISIREGKATNRSRAYFTPQFAYLLSASGTKADMKRKDAEVTRVFESFRILPQK